MQELVSSIKKLVHDKKSETFYSPTCKIANLFDVQSIELFKTSIVIYKYRIYYLRKVSASPNETWKKLKLETELRRLSFL